MVEDNFCYGQIYQSSSYILVAFLSLPLRIFASQELKAAQSHSMYRELLVSRNSYEYISKKKKSRESGEYPSSGGSC